jgi:hypothetical protein
MATIKLSGDGIVENLYHYLWAKDAMFEQGPYVCIPDTVIYKFQAPTFWYFTAKDGSIKRKNKTSLFGKMSIIETSRRPS